MPAGALPPKNPKDGETQRPVVVSVTTGSSSDFTLPQNVNKQTVSARKSKKIVPIEKNVTKSSTPNNGNSETDSVDEETRGYKLNPQYILIGTFINFVLVLVCLGLVGTGSTTINAEISNNGSKRFNYTFRCSKNESLQSINNDGSFSCTKSGTYHTTATVGTFYGTSITQNLSYSSCPNNTYMKGLFSNNTVSCEALPSAEKGDKGDKGDQGKYTSIQIRGQNIINPRIMKQNRRSWC